MNLIRPRPKMTRTYTGRAVVQQTEAWTGESDATVTPDPIRYRAKPSWGDWLRLLEFEDAAADWRAARTSDDPGRRNRAWYRFCKAQESMDQRVRFTQRTQEIIHGGR